MPENVKKRIQINKEQIDIKIADYGEGRFNPDPNVNRFGNLYSAYASIASNPIVKTCESFIRAGILYIPYSINCVNNYKQYPEYEKLDKEIKELICYCIDNLSYTTFDDVLGNLLDARIYGLCIAEKNYRIEDGRIYLDNIKTKPFNNVFYEFITDEYANLTAIQYTTPNGQQLIEGYNLQKLILATYPTITNGNFWGESEYIPIQSDVRLMERMLKMLEKGTQYINVRPILSYTEDGIDNDVLNKIKSNVDKLDNASILHLPASRSVKDDKIYESVMLKVLEPRSDPEGILATQEVINRLEMRIKQTLGVPQDLIDKGSGSYAKAGVQYDMYTAKVECGQKWLEGVVNRQIIKQLVDLNYPNTLPEEYKIPQFAFEESDQKVTLEKAQMLDILIKNKVIHPRETWIRTDYLNMPVLEQDLFEQDELKEQEKQQEEMDKLNIQKEQQNQQNNKMPQEKPKINSKDEVQIKDKDKQYSLFQSKPKAYNYPTSKLINYNRIAENFDRIENKAVNELDYQFIELKRFFNEKAIVYLKTPKGNKEKPNDYFVTSTKYRNAIKAEYQRLGIEAYLSGKYEAFSELKTLGYDKFAYTENVDRFSVTSDNNKLINELLKKYNITLSKKDRELLANIAEQASLTTDNQLTNIESQVKQAVINKLQTGLNDSNILTLQQQITEAFNPFITTGIINDKSAEPYRVQTATQTMSTKYFNDARMTQFTAPEYQGIIVAYRYDAVMDYRTSEFCSSHNGQVIESGDPVLQGIVPPNHYGCRSVLSPITIVDNYTANWDYSIKPQKGFI